MSQPIERIRFVFLLAASLCFAVPASASADLTSTLTQPTAGAIDTAQQVAGTVETSAQGATTSEPVSQTTTATQTTPAPTPSTAVSSTTSSVTQQADTTVSSTTSSVAESTEKVGSADSGAVPSTDSASSASGTVSKAIDGAKQTVQSTAAAATGNTGDTQRKVASTVGSTSNTLVQTVDSVDQQTVELISGSGLPPAGGPPGGGSFPLLPGGGGGGIFPTLPGALLPIDGPLPIDPDGLLGPIPPGFLSTGPPHGGLPLLGGVYPFSLMAAPPAGPGFAFRDVLSQLIGQLDSRLFSALNLAVGNLFSFAGAALEAGQLTVAGPSAPAIPDQGPTPFAFPSIGGGFAQSLLLFSGLLALLTLFLLKAPGLGRRIRISADLWRPPGFASPLELPG
jgi:hypothetical protein